MLGLMEPGLVLLPDSVVTRIETGARPSFPELLRPEEAMPGNRHIVLNRIIGLSLWIQLRPELRQ